MIEHHTPRTRDLAQEIDDVSSLLAALLTEMRRVFALGHVGCVGTEDVRGWVAAVDAAHASFADVQPDPALVDEVAAAAPTLAQAEAYHVAVQAMRARREAGFGSRVVVGDRTTYLHDEAAAELVYMHPVERTAYLRYREALGLSQIDHDEAERVLATTITALRS